MGENNNAGNEDEKINTAETGAEDQDESQNDGGADSDSGDSGSENDKSEDDTNVDDDKATDDESKKPTPPADEEPKTRKRNNNIDFILKRKDEKIQKLKEKEQNNDVDEENDSEDDDNLDDDTKEVIEKAISKRLAPLAEKAELDEIKQEIGDFIKENPDFAPYAAKVEKFALHPSRKELPVKSIFWEVAGPDLLILGAKRAKAAIDDSKESAAGGSTADGGASETSVWDLDPEAFAAQQEQVRRKG